MGEKLAAKVARVSPGGLELHLSDFNVTGFLPKRVLGERVEVKGDTLIVRAGKRRLSFSEGQAVGVKLADVDFLRLQVLLELV